MIDGTKNLRLDVPKPQKPNINGAHKCLISILFEV